ncbi:hypothetical protein DFH11DRAFT_361122 [Phellopilus nigrolimitatus]|nr:hypothetical protein DFH11DRAFT_361122 [Phellopilus nigrolimitatus]
MSAPAADDDPARDVVAIFHASFHPTKGNIVDWALKADDDISLDGVEFSVLPSGLHLVERDIVYFSHGAHTGLAVFRRRPTRARAHRGFRLSSLAVLLRPAPRPRPWLHAAPLRALADSIYAAADAKEEDLLGLSTSASGSGSASEGELTETDFAPARAWFERRRAEEHAATQSWSGWSDELDGTYSSPSTPTHHLPHLLRILGLSSLTLYKFVLSRRRVMIFTLPPVEVAGVLAWIASDLCREHHMATKSSALGTPIPSLFSSHKTAQDVDEPPPQSPSVLGMVTLNDLQRLNRESEKGLGWIACTTDAIFLEKPQYYDLIIDLTTSTPSKASRPTLYMSKPVPASSNGKRRASWKLESVRFTWSDVKLWTELDRILKLDSSQAANHPHAHEHSQGLCLPGKPGAPVSASGRGGSAGSPTPAPWADAFALYEDVCLLCATLWMGLGTWRSNSHQSFSTAAPGAGGARAPPGAWGAIRLEGDDDWSLEGTHMRALGRGIEGGVGGSSVGKKDKDKDRDGAKIRALGLGIEGRPSSRAHSHVVSTPPARKASLRTASLSSTAKTARSSETGADADDERQGDEDREGEGEEMSEEDAAAQRRQRVQTTLALLQTFHANTVFWLSKLREVIPPPSATSSPGLSPSRDRGGGGGDEDEDEETIVVTARDLLALDLGVLSELDARFVEWLAEAEGYAYALESGAPRSRSRTSRRRIVVKRGWGELLGIVFGFK